MSVKPLVLIPEVETSLLDEEHLPQPRGAEILIQALIHEGVDSIFGYPGGAVLHIYDELWRFRDRVTHYLVRHEQGAVHMAEGYARASGRVGVALVTSGPGATNALTGIANAYMDSTPIVVITGQVPTPLIGTDAFQEVDTVGITRSCVKHNYLVRDVRDLAPVVHEAFHLARTGRPGPIVIDIPKDVSAARTSFSRLTNISFPFVERTARPDPNVVAQAAKVILQSERPVLYVGGGVVNSGAAAALLAFAEELQLPVTPTLMGLGGFPSVHPFCLNMLGMHGTYAANMAVAESDLLIAVGVRFDDRVTGKLATFAPQARVIHIDIDPANVGKNRAPEISLIADAREALIALLEKIRSFGQTQTDQKRRASQSLVGAPARLAAGTTPSFLRLGGSDQTAIRDSRTVSPDRWRCADCHRCRATPNVGGAILPFQTFAAMDNEWRVGRDGIWRARGHWCATCARRSTGGCGGG
jgi:acetolactate synthase I/II/III large subunit